MAEPTFLPYLTGRQAKAADIPSLAFKGTIVLDESNRMWVWGGAAYFLLTASTGGGTTPPPTPISTSFVGDSTSLINNPERGWYAWSDGNARVDQFTASGLAAVYASGARLTLGLVNIGAFLTGPISDAHLATLRTNMAKLAVAGVKCIWRICYNYGENTNEASQSQAVAHVAQLAPILNDFQHVIAIVQAGVIGKWGEQHSTPMAQSKAAKIAVRDALLAAVPAGLPIEWRYPRDVMEWYPNAADSPFGIYNDYLLNGVDDGGTFSQYAVGVSSPYDTAAQRAWAKTGSERTTYGGELGVGEDGSRRLSDAELFGDMADYHWSYFNRENGSGPIFFTTWKASGAYDKIPVKLGCRIQLDSINVTSTGTGGTPFTAVLQLRNIGSARSVQSRPIRIGLVNASTGALVASGLAGDGKTLAPQATASSSMTASFALTGVSAGSYQLVVYAPDRNSALAGDARFAHQFGNANNGAQQWNAARGWFNTGLSVTADGSGGGTPTPGDPTTIAYMGSEPHYDVTLTGTAGFRLTPTLAGNITQAGGMTIGYSAVGAAPVDDTGNPQSNITYSGGTPIASGVVNTGLLTTWGSTSSGANFPISNAAAGVTHTVVVPVVVYGSKVAVTVSCADGSGTPVTQFVDAGAASVGTSARLTFAVKPKDATGINVKVEQVAGYSGGNAHIFGVWVKTA